MKKSIFGLLGLVLAFGNGGCGACGFDAHEETISAITYTEVISMVPDLRLIDEDGIEYTMEWTDPSPGNGKADSISVTSPEWSIYLTLISNESGRIEFEKYAAFDAETSSCGEETEVTNEPYRGDKGVKMICTYEYTVDFPLSIERNEIRHDFQVVGTVKTEEEEIYLPEHEGCVSA